jgi:phage shock protein A
MNLVIRIWNLLQGLASRLLSFFERRNPEALLELEKENLRKLIGRFNEGLISHAALSERLMTQLTRSETEELQLTAKIQAHLKADNRKPAARYALQLKQVTARLAEDHKQLEAAEATYSNLVGTRDAAVAEARNKIEQVRRQIGDLKVKRAVADLESMASAMVSDLGGAGDSLNRLHEMVGEEREKAAARARVAGGRVDASDLAIKEAEQDALAEQALEEFLSDDETDDPGPPLALPDLTNEREPVPVARPRKNGNEQ